MENISAEYFCAKDIARATGASKKTVHRTAQREQWPCRRDGNRDEYQVPANIAQIIIASPRRDQGQPVAPAVRFADLTGNDAQRENVLLREKAVKLLIANIAFGKERALDLVIQHMNTEHPLFKLGNKITLRQWHAKYEAHGIDGLCEQKRGRVGVKPFVNDLTDEQILQGRAAAIEHGNARRGDAKAQLNIASAFRDLAGSPTINGSARRWLHGAYASKSYVPPSVRDALRTPELATKLIQIGPKAMKLDGAFTECTYDNVPAGHTFTADDMTANCYVWVEWPNDEGFILIRPQILAVADVGSQCWLNIRAVMRPKGQYNKDDVWGLIGDTLDEYGLFKQAVLEGGTWQSSQVIGQKTNLDDATRFGGLSSLGVKVIHTRTPRGKIIEQMFNVLQHAADNVPGFCGRMEMKDCPETVKQQKALVANNHAHPRQFFLHLSQYTEHLKKVMNALNHTRNDGKVLRGEAPADKWAADAPAFEVMPDHAKWLYRSSYRVLEITRNGARIGVGSGRNMIHHTWSNPEALEQWRGRKVIVFWNDANPEADALIYSIRSGKQDKFICRAEYVNPIPKFGATEEQTAKETLRKKLSSQVARTHAASLAPYLQRSIKTLAARPLPGQEVGEQLEAAANRHVQKEVTKANTRRLMSSVEVPEEFQRAGLSATTGNDAITSQPAEMSTEEMNEILTGGQSHPLIPQAKPGLTVEGGKTFYSLKPVGNEEKQYVDYLLKRLTEFRKAGKSFGQDFHGSVNFGITRRITANALGGDIYAPENFDRVCAYLTAKIDATILGKRNLAKGTPNYHEFSAVTT